MGVLNFDTDIQKTVDISKTVDLVVLKTVDASVSINGKLATAEASADATFTLVDVPDTFELVDEAAGLSRDELHEAWWERALNFSTGEFPFLQTDGSVQDLDQDVPGVFFVDGFGNGEVTRSFDVPFGATLALPLINTSVIRTDPDENIVQQAADFFDSIIPDSLELTIDGTNVPLSELLDTRAATGEFDLVVEEGGALLVQFGDFFVPPLMPGDIVDVAADGYFVLIDGLAPGPHTLVFGGATDTGFETQVTANIIATAASATLAETDTFAQVSDSGAFAFSESLAAMEAEMDLVLG